MSSSARRRPCTTTQLLASQLRRFLIFKRVHNYFDQIFAADSYFACIFIIMSILGNYLRARESSYFKTEQEAQLQSHRANLVKEGKLNDNAQDEAERNQEQSFDASAAIYDVLPEVLQAQTRVDDPQAARRKQYERRVKGEAAQASEEELRRYRAAAYGMGSAVGHIPRISLSGRNRYGIHIASCDAANGVGVSLRQPARALSPEAAEMARRSFVASVRAAAYGLLLGVGVVAVGGTLAAQALGTGSTGKEQIRALCHPFAAGLRARAAPVQQQVHAWLAPASAGSTADGQSGGAREFQSRMQQRYNPRRGEEVSVP